jgi:hypothetical protein
LVKRKRDVSVAGPLGSLAWTVPAGFVKRRCDTVLGGVSGAGGVAATGCDGTELETDGVTGIGRGA